MAGTEDNPRAELRIWASIDRQWAPPAVYQSNRTRKDMHRTAASEINGIPITARET